MKSPRESLRGYLERRREDQENRVKKAIENVEHRCGESKQTSRSTRP